MFAWIFVLIIVAALGAIFNKAPTLAIGGITGSGLILYLYDDLIVMGKGMDVVIILLGAGMIIVFTIVAWLPRLFMKDKVPEK